MKKFIEEFKAFAMRGNVLDMAVGVVIGGAFGKITTSLVNDIIMPVVSVLTNGIDFSQWKLVLQEAVVTAAGEVQTPEVAINFGKPNQTWLDRLTPAEARRYEDEGQFAPGSMLPKVQAALSFAESAPGRVALITLLEKAKDGIEGKTGTRIHQ